MAYGRMGLARGGPQDWGQEQAAKTLGSANVPASNPYSNAAQQQNRTLNERVSREGRSNISRRNYQQGVKDFYNKHQGGGRNIFSGIGNIFGGLKNKLGAWAGNMRGGINPLTNEYYTQDEYEQNVQDRRDRATIDRLRRTRDEGKYANDPEGWAASDLSGRLGGLEKQFGIDQPVDASGLFEQEQIDASPINNRVNFNDFEGVNFNEGITKAEPGLTMMEEFYNTPITKRWSDQTGVDLQTIGMNQDQLDAINKKHQQNLAVDQGTTDFFTWNPQQKDVAGFVEDIKGKDTTGWFSDTPTDIVYGDPTTGAQTQEIQDYINSLSNIHGPIQDQRQSGYAGKRLIGIAQGGRVGYNEGGRVGILAAF